MIVSENNSLKTEIEVKDKRKRIKIMAFINERVPENEKKEFWISEYEKVIPSKWTIDREKNIILFKYGTNRDEPSEINFAYVWKDKVFDIIFSKETFDPNIVKWTIDVFYIPDEYQDRKEEILDDLREAMGVYGFAGFQFYDMEPVEVVINF